MGGRLGGGCGVLLWLISCVVEMRGVLTCEVGWEAFLEGGDMGEEGHGEGEIVEVHGGCGGGGKFDTLRRRM